MAELKTFLFIVLRKYHIDPATFFGKLHFEIEIKKGDIELLNHSLTKTTVTMN